MHQEVRDHTTRDQLQNNFFKHHYIFVGMAGNPVVISSSFYLFCIKLCFNFFLNEQAKDLPFSLIKKKRVGRLINGWPKNRFC
jgi:hypothetical protein